MGLEVRGLTPPVSTRELIAPGATTPQNIDATREAVFTLHDAQLAYEGRAVLTNVSLTICAGERVALVGKSGVGKSTLLSALREQLPEGLAWCPQQAGLVPTLSVYHNIYMGGLQRHGSFYNLLNLIKPLSQPLQEVTELAALLQLDDMLRHPAEQLSGGQLQRVAIARALYQQQAVFLGDEPVSALDDYQGEKYLRLLGEKHQTLVLALHDVNQALSVCDRLIGLKDGAIVIDAPCVSLSPGDLTVLYC